MKKVRIKGHYVHRKGKRIYVRPHVRMTVTSLERGRTGERFKRLASTVAREYMKKGYSRARALEIGKAVAGKAFWRRYGRPSGRRILRRER